MTARLNAGLTRVVAARQRMMKARVARSEALQRLRSFASARLAEFIGNVDPITGSRLVEIVAEGSKTTGDLSVTVAFLDGTKLRIAVDPFARIAVEATPADALHGLGRVLDISVSADLSRAELTYEPTLGPRGSRRTLDLDEIIARLVDNFASAVEEEIAGVASDPGGPPPVAAVAAVPRPALKLSVG